MRRTYQIAIVVFAWLAGLGLANQLSTHLASWLWLVIAVGFWLVAVMLRSKLGYVALAGLALVAGLMRGQMYFTRQQELTVSDYQGAKVVAVGRVVGEPRWNDDKLYEFYLDDVRIDGKNTLGVLKVKSLVGSPREGQIVRAEGKVGRASGRADSQIWYAQVDVINSVQPYPV